MSSNSFSGSTLRSFSAGEKTPQCYLSSSLPRTNINFTVLKWNQFMASLRVQKSAVTVYIPWIERLLIVNSAL